MSKLMNNKKNDSSLAFIFGVMWLALFIFPLNAEWLYFVIALTIFLSVNLFLNPFKDMAKKIQYFWFWFFGAVIINISIGIYLSFIEKGEFTVAFVFLCLYALCFPFLNKGIKYLNEYANNKKN